MLMFHELLDEYLYLVQRMMWLIVILGVLCTLMFGLLIVMLKLSVRHVKNSQQKPSGTTDSKGREPITVGFFHPYCNAGGGGERVLWTAIKAINDKYPDYKCVIYTGDTDAKPEEIINKASNRFNIRLPKPVTFVYLHHRGWVEASKYPVFTLIGQSLGSLVLGFEALLSFVPDVYIDSMGYAFTLPLFKYFGGCRVGCYVHYPTISTDMLDKVTQRTAGFNNSSFISNSVVISQIKLIYYKLFAYLYGIMGSKSDVIMVNSSWTANHINSIWKSAYKTSIVYPSCDVAEFLSISPEDKLKSEHLNIISVAQFRPEKDHPLQVKSFSKFLSNQQDKSLYKLLVVGSCRNDEDSERVQKLRDLTKELDIENNVEFHLNVSFAELKRLMSISTIGLHTMWNEHFGIGVVECMAASTIILAHNSGGPKLDIVTPYQGSNTGYLADTEDSYAEKMAEIFQLSAKEKTDIIENARNSVLERFQETEFVKNFLDSIDPLLNVQN